MKLIDKDALVVEIERRIKSLHQVNSPREQAVLYECKDILSFLDTLEVKEMDLEKENIIGTFEREVKIDAAGYPYIDEIEFYDYDKGIPLAKEGDKVKVIIVKEE